MSSIRRSLFFSFGEKYGVYALTLIGTVILARLLTPADFGLFAVGASVVMLVEVFRDFGVGTYLVQEREITRESVRSAFTVTLVLSVACALLLLASADAIAAFYGEPGLAGVMALFAANFLLFPFATPSTNLLRRDLAFDRLAGINLLGALAQLLAVAGLALLGHGYMSLAWGMLASNLVRTAGAIACKPLPWAFRPSLAAWRGVLAFGGYSTAAAVINTFHDSLPQLIIGRVLGLGPVGLYGRATMVCQLPDKLVVSALHPVILPSLAEHARRDGDLKGPYLLALTHMTALQWPALLCLALLADPVVLLLLGDQWGAVPPLVRIISLGSLALFPAFMTYPTMVALGRVRDTLTMSLISLPPSIALIFGLSFLGIEAVAAAQFINAPLQVFVAVSFIRRHLPIAWREIALATRASAVVSLSAVAAPLAAVALNGFRFDLSIPAMLLAAAGAAIGWGIGLLVSGHPMLDEAKAVAALLRRQLQRLAPWLPFRRSPPRERPSA